ncbi:hypothetical protein QBC34DRAFT_461419 [Podospora aff. communis PSN243]|uniref:Ankyrin n=1 Tax=Podospora aff. communis PSN243 TaxID=3040156 RepID=A0AAV9GPQ5_9PEZI|nr:hypothetical protein QBC34DRAFT_461419 [Podospora aff. communis PSN243]
MAKYLIGPPVDGTGERAQTRLRDLARFNRCCRWVYAATIEMLYKTDAKNKDSHALIWGAANGNMTLMELALEYGADVNKVSWCPSHAVLKSVSVGDEWRVGFDPRRHPCKGAPLHFAARNDHLEAAQWLLDHGASESLEAGSLGVADLFKYDRSRVQANTTQTRDTQLSSAALPWFPALVALWYNNFTVLKMLVQNGATLDRGYKGWLPGDITALHLCHTGEVLIPSTRPMENRAYDNVLELLALDAFYRANDNPRGENLAAAIAVFNHVRYGPDHNDHEHTWNRTYHAQLNASDLQAVADFQHQALGWFLKHSGWGIDADITCVADPPSVIKVLLRMGTDPNHQWPAEEGYTLLHMAARWITKDPLEHGKPFDSGLDALPARFFDATKALLYYSAEQPKHLRIRFGTEYGDTVFEFLRKTLCTIEGGWKSHAFGPTPFLSMWRQVRSWLDVVGNGA